MKRCVELLLSHGSPLFIENHDKFTPCDMAMRNDHHDIAQLLESRMVFVSIHHTACYSMVPFIFPLTLFPFILIQIAHIFWCGTSKTKAVELTLNMQEKHLPTMQCVLLYTVSQKGIAGPVHSMNVYRGSRAIAPLILNRDTR